MNTPICRTNFLAILLLASSQLACAANQSNRLTADVEAMLDKADQIELISLSPEHLQEAPKDAFYRWRVLGRTMIKGEDKVAALKALRSGIAANEGMVAGCFNPRHGIRVTHDGKTTDLVICFECMSIQVFQGEKQLANVLTTADAKPLFDKLLAAAKVPLAAKATD